jgi:hypothetical protein
MKKKNLVELKKKKKKIEQRKEKKAKWPILGPCSLSFGSLFVQFF